MELLALRSHLEARLPSVSFATPSHPRPVPSFSFHFFLAPILPRVTAVSPRSVPSSWQAVPGAAPPNYPGDTPPRRPQSRRRDVTPAPPPGSRGWLVGRRWGRRWDRGRGRDQGPALGLCSHCYLCGPFPSPAPRPSGPSGARWPRHPRLEGHRGFRGWTSSAAQCQAPPQLCEFEAAGVALGGGRARRGPLMVPPRRHRGAERPGRQGRAPKSPGGKTGTDCPRTVPPSAFGSSLSSLTKMVTVCRGRMRGRLTEACEPGPGSGNWGCYSSTAASRALTYSLTRRHWLNFFFSSRKGEKFPLTAVSSPLS